MNVRGETLRLRARGYLYRIVPRRASGIAGNARANYLWNLRNSRRDFPQFRFRHRGASHHFNHVAETAGGERFSKWIRGCHLLDHLDLLPQFLADDARSFHHRL